MTTREFLLALLRKVEVKLDPPYRANTPEQRLLDRIFLTPRNRPWPKEVQPMPGNFWYGDHDDYDWACYVAECVIARTSTLNGMLEVAHSILVTAASQAKDKDEPVYRTAHQAEKALCIHLESLEERGIPYYYDPNFGDDRVCGCSHAYYRHFDTYDDMEPVGCKYCDCFSFTTDETIS